jgi:hypothetical protein
VKNYGMASSVITEGEGRENVAEAVFEGILPSILKISKTLHFRFKIIQTKPHLDICA